VPVGPGPGLLAFFSLPDRRYDAALQAIAEALACRINNKRLT